MAYVAYVASWRFLSSLVVQAAFWLNPPEYPQFVTSQLPLAREWGRKQFAARTRATG